MKYYLFATFCSAILLSCAMPKKTSKILDSWIGDTKQNLIMSWGPPTTTEPDGNNGEILIYSERFYKTVNSNPIDYWEYKMMYVNADDKIYHWLFRRNPNPPERIDIRILIQ